MRPPLVAGNGEARESEPPSIKGERVRIPWTKLIASWKTGQDAIEWGAKCGLTAEQLANAGFLMRHYGTDEATGKQFPLAILKVSIGRDSRFARWLDWQGFLDIRKHSIDWNALVEGWTTPEDVFRWADQRGIDGNVLGVAHELTLGRFFDKESQQFVSLQPLYKAINRAKHRFPRWRDWQTFLKLSPGELKHLRVTLRTSSKLREPSKLVGGWETPGQAQEWGMTQGMTLQQLGDQRYLLQRGFTGVVKAICARFRDSEASGWSRWRDWLGLPKKDGREKGHWVTLIRSWKKPEDAREWARSQQLDPQILGNSEEIRKSVGGGLLDAISKQWAGGYPGFRTWLGLEDKFKGLSTGEKLQELFESPEGRALEALARELGEAALAEYLCAKYQDRFKRYSTDLIENLRAYLGEIEYAPGASPESLPASVFTITGLENLRQAIFAHYRDAFGEQYAQGLSRVVKLLEERRQMVELHEHRNFIDTLIEYYQRVDALPSPSRLKKTLGREIGFPAPHQRVAAYEALTKKAVLIADEMGGGKSGSAIASFELARDQGLARKALIVCPAKVIPVWKRILAADQEGYFKERSAPRVAVINHTAESWREAASADYVVISIERTRDRKETGSLLRKIEGLGADFLVVDESHNMKSVLGSDAERLFQISQLESIRNGHLVLLSGTPAPNTLQDIAAQIRLLYAGREAVNGCDVNNHKELARLVTSVHPLLVRNLLVPRMLRRETEKQLPVGQSYSRELVTCAFDEVERLQYDAYFGNPFMTAPDKLRALRQFSLRSESKYRLLVKSIRTALDRPKYQAPESVPKILVAETQYARGVTRDENHERPTEAPGMETYIAERLRNEFAGELHVFILDGDNSDRRLEVLQDFARCQQPALLLTLVPVVGEGLDITCASDGILLSPAFNHAAEDQFGRRMFRSGQKKGVHLQILCISDSVEEGLLRYAQRKNEVVSAVVNGRPLTKDELELVANDAQKIRRGGSLAYEVMSPRQRALWILSRMMGRSKQEIRDLLSAHDGRFARDFARGYPVDEETSYSGNTTRVVAATINMIVEGPHSRLADIACGCLTLERMYAGSDRISVSGVDINRAALQAGVELLPIPREIEDCEVGTMDDLPFQANSQDIAVLSLALHFTQHSPKRGEAGLERIRALSELNRVLRIGGRAVIALQDRLFGDEEQFTRFSETVANEFGFAIDHNFTGRVDAKREPGDPEFKVWLLTMSKVAESAPDLGNMSFWRNLMFPKIRRNSGYEELAPARNTPAQATKPKGTYYDSFTIGGKELEYQPPTEVQRGRVAERREAEEIGQRLHERVDELIKTHGRIENIPEHLLLSISPVDIMKARQEERDRYFKVLLDKFGAVKKVPIAEISRESSVILIRGRSKKGEFLCLAQVTSDGSARGFGRRYFFNS